MPTLTLTATATLVASLNLHTVALQRQRRLTVERMAASMSDDGADDAPQDGGRPAVMRWRSGRLLDRRVCFPAQHRGGARIRVRVGFGVEHKVKGMNPPTAYQPLPYPNPPARRASGRAALPQLLQFRSPVPGPACLGPACVLKVLRRQLAAEWRPCSLFHRPERPPVTKRPAPGSTGSSGCTPIAHPIHVFLHPPVHHGPFSNVATH